MKVADDFYFDKMMLDNAVTGENTNRQGCTDAIGGPLMFGCVSIVIVLLAWSAEKSSYIRFTVKGLRFYKYGQFTIPETKKLIYLVNEHH